MGSRRSARRKDAGVNDIRRALIDSGETNEPGNKVNNILMDRGEEKYLKGISRKGSVRPCVQCTRQLIVHGEHESHQQE